MIDTLKLILGAIAGGVVGYFGFAWMLQQGFYAMILPGGLLGLGAGFFRCRALLIAILCGIAALALGVYTEWSFHPFKTDESLGYFVANLHKLTGVTKLMIIVGGFIGFWGPFSNWKRWRHAYINHSKNDQH